jgi:hypothetical protein
LSGAAAANDLRPIAYDTQARVKRNTLKPEVSADDLQQQIKETLEHLSGE